MFITQSIKWMYINIVQCLKNHCSLLLMCSGGYIQVHLSWCQALIGPSRCVWNISLWACFLWVTSCHVMCDSTLIGCSYPGTAKIQTLGTYSTLGSHYRRTNMSWEDNRVIGVHRQVLCGYEAIRLLKKLWYHYRIHCAIIIEQIVTVINNLNNKPCDVNSL